MLNFLTKPHIVFYTLPWLMVLIILGTISQRYIGLYESEKLFFSNWIFWIGPMPMPGTPMILAVMAISLLAKLALKSPWKAGRYGTFITHLGVLLLLGGGLLTSISSEEGYMMLGEGQTSNTVSDYHQRNLVILKDEAPIYSIPHEQLVIGKEVKPGELPFSITPEILCRNCRLYVPEDTPKGAMPNIKLVPVPLANDNEENRAGLGFTVSGQEGRTRIAMENLPFLTQIKAGGEEYQVVIRKAERSLPFKVTLNDFQKMTHPGMDMAREYQSTVTVTEGEGVSWQSDIRMNEPLRVQGYTLYQSAFVQADGQEMSVLAVVKNYGRTFPYIASIVIAIGLIVHLATRKRSNTA